MYNPKFGEECVFLALWSKKLIASLCPYFLIIFPATSLNLIPQIQNQHSYTTINVISPMLLQVASCRNTSKNCPPSNLHSSHWIVSLCVLSHNIKYVFLYISLHFRNWWQFYFFVTTNVSKDNFVQNVQRDTYTFQSLLHI